MTRLTKPAMALAFASLFTTGSALAAAKLITLDTAQTTMAFLIDHLGFAKTPGYFSAVSGSFAYDADTGEVNNVSITIETDSIESDNEGAGSMGAR